MTDSDYIKYGTLANEHLNLKPPTMCIQQCIEGFKIRQTKTSVKFNASRVEQSQIPTRGGVADSDGSEIRYNIEYMS